MRTSTPGPSPRGPAHRSGTQQTILDLKAEARATHRYYREELARERNKRIRAEDNARRFHAQLLEERIKHLPDRTA